MRSYPAVELSWPTRADDDTLERLLAELDDLAPTAIEERPHGLRVFFSSLDARDRALDVVAAFDPSARREALLVSDEAWAERSQQLLPPVTVGRITVAPPWIDVGATSTASAADGAPIWITIQPSMGFGTGHHPSTRLCLRLLQTTIHPSMTMLDVGTGSGVLAIAAWRLGAVRVLAVDLDPDALASAAENIQANGAGQTVVVQLLDFSRAVDDVDGSFDIVTANLTGAMLERDAAVLASAARSGGAVLASGFQLEEEPAVIAAFAVEGLVPTRRVVEQDWVAIAFRA